MRPELGWHHEAKAFVPIPVNYIGADRNEGFFMERKARLSRRGYEMILPPGFKRLKNQRTAEPYFSEIKTEVSNDRIKN